MISHNRMVSVLSGQFISSKWCTQPMLHANGVTQVPTYLSRDWGRDWGSLRRFDPVVEAPEAHLNLATATRSGLWNPGPIRIGP
ncbi:hypothetical protein FHU31_004639 [Mycolicibacterium fluoranthenivorans]|uniref:Arabinosyltransferase C-terminal domain-containing protein n=1 Tax=Mycolicibacterium fluoranthenivorans TaxID=258505 RepID=A0A7X5ZEW3_9MYCO|nr:hypothetical protein [Mycolicibacterium fluoranthenivorans]